MANHPITPPPALVNELQDLGNLDAIALAYRAGADQELEACCEWLDDTDCDDPQELAQRLRAARRPEPLSLKDRIAAAITDGDERKALKLLEELDDSL